MIEFSICIPNFNYEKYIGITLDSVVKQTYSHFNVFVTDNASTDDSIKVISRFAEIDKRIVFKVNTTNVGFAGNLDKCGSMADKKWMIMLSSDDVVLPEALSEYQRFIKLLPNTEKSAFSSTFEKIDSEGRYLSFIRPSPKLWKESDVEKELSAEMGCTVYKVESKEMLKRCLTSFYNPFNFAATCYLNNSYQLVNGYGGGRVYNPDKWFHWKIMTVTDFVYFIDKPLFQYRWHQQNQQASQQDTDDLKFWFDEYRNCFDIEETMLEKASFSREEMIMQYCNHLIKYVAADIRKNHLNSAKRLLHWGKACYPKYFSKHRFYLLLLLLSRLGYLGSFLCELMYKANKKFLGINF